jgi:hypothetical protein
MKLRVWHEVMAIAATVVLMTGQLHAAGQKVRITGIHSDLSFNQEGGDLLGNEIFIVYASGGYVAFVQRSQGEPQMPRVVPVSVDGDTISFTVPDPSGQSLLGAKASWPAQIVLFGSSTDSGRCGASR